VFDVQTGTTQIPLGAVHDVRKVWTKVFGVLPLVPNGLLVELEDGTEHRFDCTRRDEWIGALAHAR